jgi:hypothetical protein
VYKIYGLLNIKCLQIIWVQGTQPCFIIEVAWETWDGFTFALDIALGGRNPDARPVTTFWSADLIELCRHDDAVKYSKPWCHSWITPLVQKNDVTFNSVSSVRLVATHTVRAHIMDDIAVTDKIFMTIGCSNTVVKKLAK